jgi:hypothetical protein
MKAFSHLRQYLAEFFLEWEIFQIPFVQGEKNTHIVFSNFFSENRAVYEMMSKYMAEPELQQRIWLMRFACWKSRATRAQTHAHARTPTPTPTQACTRMNSRARTHTHTQIRNTYCYSTATMVSWTHPDVPLCVHCLSFWIWLKQQESSQEDWDGQDMWHVWGRGEVRTGL